LRYHRGVRAAALIVVLAPACVRAPAEAVCPDLAPGELVLTELRGPQATEDAGGTWLELYNASGRRLDLAGLQLRFRHVDDSGVISVLVRRALDARIGAYVVLGQFDDADPPLHVDYGFFNDYREAWLPRAAVEITACGTIIDQARYDALPRMGTYSLGGAPDAGRNDLESSWCTDATQVGATYPGTPKSANIACP